VVWVFQTQWSERLKARIKGEYDTELEQLKARLKASSDVEIEKLKSQLNIAAAERQLRFSRLHEKRAEVIAEVYASLKRLVQAIAEYVSIFEPAGLPSRAERAARVAEAGNMFAELYSEKKIFIPKSTTLKIDEINTELRSAHLGFMYLVDAPKDPDVTKWAEISRNIAALSQNALTDLESDLRKLLGDDEP
jgi:hypothetical protein